MGGVRLIIRKETRGGGMKAHNITQQAKGLKRRPGIRVNLGRSHVKRPKDAHRKLIERERNIKVFEKTGIHIKKWGTNTWPPHTHAFGHPTRQDVEVTRVLFRL